MKKVINENTIKSIVRESLLNYLKESMDIDTAPEEVMEGEELSDDEMWDKYGNENRLDNIDGMYGILAQGDDEDDLTRYARSIRSSFADSEDAFAKEYGEKNDDIDISPENSNYLSGKFSQKSIEEAVNKAFKKIVNEIA
jgi:hypothetical protein